MTSTPEASSQPLQCLIVDDEPLARRVLISHVRAHPALALVGSFGTGREALDYFRQSTVDLLLVDVEMRGLTGPELVRSLPRETAVIFTTAYSSYAVEGFELGAVDYLLKPIERARFMKAIARVASHRALPFRTVMPPHETTGAVFLRVDGEYARVELDDIAFVEACENYVRVHTTHRVLMTKRTLNDVEGMLGSHGFARVHRSFLVNMTKVTRLHRAALTVAGKRVPVRRGVRAELLECMRRLAQGPAGRE